MQYPSAGGGRRRATANAWDAARVRALRRHLGLTQEELAGELGMRQQTVSEWETSSYRPRGASLRLLSLIAERAGFSYDATAGEDSNAGSNGERPEPAGS